MSKISKKTLIYQMYPAAWPGGFPNMTKHLERVKELHADYVYLSPFYKSPWVDGGYDIQDYCSVDERFGTMEDFDNFVSRANELGMKVIIDLVLNHTSKEHEWFLKSSNPNDPEYEKYKDYYIWTDKDLRWTNFCGAPSASTHYYQRDQYAMHLFHESQRDLNWANPEVEKEFEKIFFFWLIKHGVGGFRIDMAQYLYRELKPAILPGIFGIPRGFFHYFQKAKTLEIYHRLFDGREIFTFAEAGFPTKRMLRKLAGKNGPLTAAQNTGITEVCAFFGHQSLPFLKRLIRSWGKEAGYVAHLECHDTPRPRSRFLVFNFDLIDLVFSSNPQIVQIYQGEELGLYNPDLGDDISKYQDIMSIEEYKRRIAKGEDRKKVMADIRNKSRDNARQPIDVELYEVQKRDPESYLNYMTHAIEKWKS